MELNDDLIAIQGILMSVIKTTGEFTKIYYRGGNEEKILKVIEGIQKHIASKNYFKNGKINTIFDKQIENIVFFLAVNTKYTKPLELEEYEHLTHIMPQLSKCVLANLVYGLDLCKYYCKVIEKLPLSYGIELLEDIVPCLKKSVPEVQLEYAIMFLTTIAMKLSSQEISNKNEEDVYKLSELANIILIFLTGINSGHVGNLKAVQIYQHMGYTLLNLFKLLLYCNKENINLKKFIQYVVRTCCAIIKNVTINVYCSWAEIDEGDQSLQSVVSGTSYLFIEQYQKHEEAKELISMLGAISRKPRSLGESIRSADTATIIKKVNVADKDQKAWFKALLGIQVFNNEDAVRCVSTFSHLCDENDVIRLLNFCQQSKKVEAKRVAVKCASTIPLHKLIIVLKRYFYEYNVQEHIVDGERIESQLRLISNKMTNNTITDDGFVKDMCLMLLSNPVYLLKNVYRECLKEICYTQIYLDFFQAVKDIVKINNFGVDSLYEVISKELPDSNNIDNYSVLLKALYEADYLTDNQLINILLLPLLDQYYSKNQYQHTLSVLEIFLGSSVRVPSTPDMSNARWKLLNMMDECRCTYLEMDLVKQDIVNSLVEIINDACDMEFEYNVEAESHNSASENYNEFTNFYKDTLFSVTNVSLLQYLYPILDIDNCTVCVRQLLQYLPRGVASEWYSIIEEIFFLCDSEKATDILFGVMVLLANVTITQNPSSSIGKQMFIALKYCLRMFGLALKRIQIDCHFTTEEDITKCVAKLLKYLPDEIKEVEGLFLVTILSERSVFSLRNDPEFTTHISAAKCFSISHTILNIIQSNLPPL